MRRMIQYTVFSDRRSVAQRGGGGSPPPLNPPLAIVSPDKSGFTYCDCCPGVGKNRRHIQADSEAAGQPAATEA